MASSKPIIGSIFERKSTLSSKSPAPSLVAGSRTTGFPAVQHRSKSAFSRNREEVQRRDPNGTWIEAPPVVSSSNPTVTTQSPTPLSSPLSGSGRPTPDPSDLHEQISKENEAVLAAMSPEEIEEERQQILARFGAGLTGVLEKARQNRLKRGAEGSHSKRHNGVPPSSTFPQTEHHDSLPEVPISVEERKPAERALSPPPALSAASSRPSSRAENRRLRFAELEPKDVYVYESSPPSPRKPLLALLPPPDKPDSSTVSLGQFHGRMATEPQAMGIPEPSDNGIESEKPNPAKFREKDPDEGTPEYIRRRYFPNVPADDPNIEWMKRSDDDAQSDSSIRFDLHGAPIPLNLTSTLPTHLGLHHHAEGSHAGYTLDDIFLLSRSTVPAQRAAMFGVLAGISQRLSKLAHGQTIAGLEELSEKEEPLRKRIAAAGVEAMNERGGVGLQAIEVIWSTIYDWDRDLVPFGLEGIFLESSADETVRSLPLDFVLPSVAAIFNLHGEAYPLETLTQLLEVVQRLAVQNIDTATSIVATENLLAGIVRSFILPSTSERSFPDPSAIILLTSLARSSRQSAEKVSRIAADSLLRFIVSIPPSSPYSTTLSSSLIASTLDFYSILAAYGLCTHIASTAMEQFNNLSQYIQSPQSNTPPLVSSWLKLTQAWTVCAVDPHATSPPHDILWSRVSAWGWHSDALQISSTLNIESPEHWRAWGDLFGTLAAWLEGSKVNGLKGGEKERTEVLDKIRDGFAKGEGKTHQLICVVIDHLNERLPTITTQDVSASESRGIVSAVQVIANVLRLWLACLPPHLEGPPTSPPFDLPYGQISTLAVTVLSHPIWVSRSTKQQPRASRYNVVHLRQFASFLGAYLKLSRRLPDTSPDLWLAQACSILLRYQPGDEDLAMATLTNILRLVPETAAKPTILEPFFEDVVFPREKEEVEDDPEVVQVFQPKARLSPLIPTPQSIGYSTTSVMTSPFSSITLKRKLSGLPLQSNWMLSPMNHLLHSGDSPVFKYLPNGWDFSELDVTRVTLALTLKVRQILSDWKLPQFAVKRGEAVLACIEVFMLEHGLVQDKSRTSEDEVFRDKVVEGLMGKLLDPYRFGARSTAHVEDGGDLETLATTFLGPSTPFYQFYTDFIALYDAISFSHPLFRQLLLPPISMRYAIDYRRHFWNDYSHILRTINVYPSQVISNDLREYMYPVESDPQVMGAYLSGLVKGTAKEFLRWLALHHIAANIWADLREEKEDGTFNQDRAIKLFQAVVTQGDTETIANVVKYAQPSHAGGLEIPPGCFNASSESLARRKLWIETTFGEEFTKRLSGLL